MLILVMSAAKCKKQHLYSVLEGICRSTWWIGFCVIRENGLSERSEFDIFSDGFSKVLCTLVFLNS